MVLKVDVEATAWSEYGGSTFVQISVLITEVYNCIQSITSAKNGLFPLKNEFGVQCLKEDC